MRLFVFGFAGCLALSGTAWSQAFNCDFAKQPDELTICRDDSLKALDESMANRFFKIRQQLPEEAQAELKSGQKAFLGQRNFCGTDGDCIENAYRERMQSLCTLASAHSVPCGDAE
jgi:uncharacterized protein